MKPIHRVKCGPSRHGVGDNAKSQRKLGSAMILECVSCCCNQVSLSGWANISGRLKLISYSLHDMGPPGWWEE